MDGLSNEEFSRQAAKPQRRPQMGVGKTTKSTKHTKGCLKACPPSGIHLPPSFVVFVVRNFEQAHAEKGWDGGREGVCSPTAPSFAALRLCVRNAFLRRCSFRAGSSEDERMGHEPSKEEFSRQGRQAAKMTADGEGEITKHTKGLPDGGRTFRHSPSAFLRGLRGKKNLNRSTQRAGEWTAGRLSFRATIDTLITARVLPVPVEHSSGGARQRF
jgi:hypothetical protein